MANPTWGEILTEMRDELSEPTAAFWTDDELMAYYNRAQMEFARKTEIIEATSTLTLSGDNLSASLPSGFLGVLAVTFINAGGSRKYLYATGGFGRSQQSKSQADLAYYLVGTATIKLTAEQPTGVSLELDYFKKPTPFADSEDTEVEGDLDLEWTGIIQQGALFYAHAKRGNEQRKRDAKAEFLTGISEAKRFKRYRVGKKQISVAY